MIFSSLVYAIVYVAFMVTTIAGSRLSSILLCRWLETRLNLLIIEYETDQERIALRTIIAAMPDALVHSQTHHYKYLNGHRIYAEEEATDTEMYIGGQSFTWVCGVWKCVIGLLLGAVMGVGLTLSGLYSIEKKSEWDTTTVKRAIIFCVPVSAIFTFLFAGRIVRGMRGAAGYKIQNSQPEVPLQTTETAASVDIEKTEAPYVDGEKTTSQSEAVVSINIDDKKE
ncbi:hypothetical protein EDC01DRAFT_285669 [Geopyxis carbonaria]|nr:hypothetical protein EDC01DRAFT_285669 [Geopyxis carbonaria]